MANGMHAEADLPGSTGSATNNHLRCLDVRYGAIDSWPPMTVMAKLKIGDVCVCPCTFMSPSHASLLEFCREVRAGVGSWDHLQIIGASYLVTSSTCNRPHTPHVIPLAETCWNSVFAPAERQMAQAAVGNAYVIHLLQTCTCQTFIMLFALSLASVSKAAANLIPCTLHTHKVN